MEFRARHFGGPLLYRAPNQDGPYDNVPLEIIAQIGADGISGQNVYFNDFIEWTGPLLDSAGAGGWKCTSVDGGGDAAEVVAPLNTVTISNGGVLRITSNDADNDNTQIQMLGSPWKYRVGKRIWFFARVAPEDADDGEIGFGLILTSDVDMVHTFPEGLFFEKAETATKMDFHAKKDATDTEKTNVDSSAMTDGVFHVYGFYVDELGNVSVYYDGTEITAAAVATGNGGLVDDQNLTVAFQIQTGTTAVTSLDIDWVLVAQDR